MPALVKTFDYTIVQYSETIVVKKLGRDGKTTTASYRFIETSLGL